jgi:hypothetical protein
MVPRERSGLHACSMASRRQRSPRRFARLSAAPDDLFDYVQPPRPRDRAPQTEPSAILVSDDWPDVVPVTDAELRVMEAHFADVLGEILGPKA